METKTEQPIIADSSGIISLATKTDQNHAIATKAAERLRQTSRPIILPVDVLVETVNVLGKKSGHQTAMKTATELLMPGSPYILIDTRPYLISSLGKFDVAPQAVSLTDCIVMTVADEWGTKEIFGFDKQFQDAGYIRLEPAR